MMVSLNEYLTELEALVDHRAQHSGKVLFRVRFLDGRHSEMTIDTIDLLGLVNADSRKGDWSLYMSNIDPLVAWERAGYIRVLTDNLQQGTSIFGLTESGIAAAKRAPGG